MLSKLRDRKKEIIMLLVGVAGSYIFIMIGYFISSILNCMASENVLLANAVEMIVNNSIMTYYTPVTLVWMIIFCVVFDAIYLFILITFRKGEESKTEEKRQEVEDNESIKVDIFDSLLQADMKEECGDKIDCDIVLPDEMNDTESVANKIIENDCVETEEKNKVAELSSEIVTELLETYNMSQVIAMSAVSKYIDGINVDLLKKMFNASMSAEEIKSYIEMFYEEY